ncbi:hypothetical protein [Mucilaginibacter sp. L3T2-6]|uniref:hypothetical protein n=1 Tax=Mucilaginibacter sp. L3T2-6 TaxID=3062491 RepID=UPI0026768633|nr:hypothetical protein [Mucilaginibacter sp. L3T2-6]MDO3642473.1 hypothetical protein [Mucilaginibacter sp. L3T2-6]MDV6215131.1 hypothetical protein [Mucilaginibacter sp. L3T2-6]
MTGDGQVFSGFNYITIKPVSYPATAYKLDTRATTLFFAVFAVNKMADITNMKLIIIDHEPYKHFKRGHFCMDEFCRYGFDVQFWSVWRALAYSKKLNYNMEEKDEDVIYFDNYINLLREIENLPQGTYICTEFWFNWDTRCLAKLLSGDKFKVFSINHYHNLSAIYYNRIRFKVSDLSFSKVRRKLSLFSYKIYKRFFEINPVSLVFLTGNKTAPEFREYKTDSISYFDVENYAVAQTTPRIINEKYIVFLDIYLPSHPDIARLRKRSISPELYYKKINAAFDKIEHQTGCEIIIAAHPKALYTNEFGSRRVISGKTAELVLHSEMVLDHSSLSINYAVQANKKAYVIFFDEFMHGNDFSNEVYRRGRNIAELINIEMINLDSDFKLSLYDNIDFVAYEKFKTEYLYAKEYPKTNFEIIKNAISTL